MKQNMHSLRPILKAVSCACKVIKFYLAVSYFTFLFIFDSRKSSKKSLSSSTDANSNKNNRYDGVASREHYDISQSHPDLAPPHRQRAPHLRFQNKSMSSGQLMAIAAKYASVAGDRVHPTAIMRSIANSEIGDVSSAESEVKVKTGKEPDLVDDPATYNDDSVIESIDNDGEGRTLIP